ncbi:hypothetical protein [Methanobacterium sp. ACI-7]|uniref:hypothetical protein n=1 Tax=unclassified Methanobacterium TaxID=2627676 RepID=UPI0039C17EBD
MKWLIEHIWWITGIFTAILIALLAIATLTGEFNTIVRIIIVPVTALIAILTTLGWKEHNKKKSEKKALISIKNELEYNLQVLGYNQNIIDEELELIEDNKFSENPQRNKLILKPLLPLKIGFWDTILIDIFPDEIKSEFLLKIREIDIHERKINEQIKSRENYKIANIEAHDISSTIKRYDRMLQKNFEELRGTLMKLGMQIYKLC